MPISDYPTAGFNRRRFLRDSALGVAALWLAPRLGATPPATAAHPRLYLSTTEGQGLRTLADLRGAIAAGGWSGATWDRIAAQARSESALPPLQPDAPLPQRPAAAIRDRNLDFSLCEVTGARLTRFALVHLVTGDEACRRAALAQLAAIFDPAQWPDWIDQAHRRFGHPADLRTGMLAMDVALAYDWLSPGLDARERAFVIEGLDRRAIQPFLVSLQQDPWWGRELNNWVTLIAGGLGIAGLALTDEHPDAPRLVAYAVAKFEEYLSVYGPAGEFNESVAYANANLMPVAFFLAHRSATRGRTNRLAAAPFPQMCRWVMHATLAGGRPLPFGDCHPDHPVAAGYVGAVAAALQDGALQHYHLALQAATASPIDLLWFDPRVPPASLAGREPLAIHFPAHGGIMVSRTAWDFERPQCIVFGKSGREENHEHNDVGQVGFDTLGERLIVDLGSPSAYPVDFFEPHLRWRYYNASVRSHNVLMFGEREQRYPVGERGKTGDPGAWSGRLTDWWHEPGQGTAWRIDLTPAYAGASQVARTVLHLWPGYILVLDEADLPAPEDISLRWHTIDRADPEADGSFVVRGQAAAATGFVTTLEGTVPAIHRREHRYVAPYHLARSGDPWVQRGESYVEATAKAAQCRWLTLFATGAAADFGGTRRWERTAAGWRFDGPEGAIEVGVTPGEISLSLPHAGRAVRLPRRT